MTFPHSCPECGGSSRDWLAFCSGCKASYHVSKQFRHGMTGTPTYVSWYSMKTRVSNPRANSNARYIGRGIDMDPRWRDFPVFFADMGHRPNGTSLERRDNDRGYWPDNCVWATRREQATNQSRNVIVSFGGIEGPVSIALDYLGKTWVDYRGARWGKKRRTAQQAIDFMAQPRLLSTETHCRHGHPYGEFGKYKSGACRECHRLCVARKKFTPGLSQSTQAMPTGSETSPLGNGDL